MRHTETCDGKRIAEIRSSQGMTQPDLAKKTGYSERLIRKAESGDAVTYTAIREIATALSQNDHTVQFEDLIFNPEQLVKQFLHAFAFFESEMAAQVEHFIDEAFVLVCAGDPQQMPFAGEWKGIEGLDQWARSFFRILVRPQKDFYKPEFLTSGNIVVSWGQDWAHTSEMSFPPIWVNQRFEFSKGKLIYFENRFDTGSSNEHIAKSRAQAEAKRLIEANRSP